jgi:hypothetical protein
MTYYYEFNSEKNVALLEDRGICFEDIIALINANKILDIIGHPNQIKYPGQKIYIVDVDGYCYLVPYVKNGDQIFLKTIIPSRKATKQYLTEIKIRKYHNEKL